MYKFDNLFPKEEKTNLKDNLLEGFKELDVKAQFDCITDNLEEQNKIAATYRRILRNVFSFSTKTKSGNINNIIINALYNEFKENFNRYLDTQKTIINENEIVFFKEIFAALAMARTGEKNPKGRPFVNENSLSIKLLNIINGKLLTLIAYNKILDLKLNLNNFKFYYNNNPLSSFEERQELLNKIKENSVFLDDVIIREIR